MGMRLLPKSEIVAQGEADKQRRIEEGLAVAKRIDRLRETQAEEDAKLEKFRREKVAAIHKEIEEARAELGPLQKQVVELRREIEKGLLPVEEALQRLEEIRKMAAHEREEADADILKAENDTKQAREEQKKAKDMLAEADAKLEYANSTFQKAEERNRESDEKRVEAGKILAAAIRFHENTEQALMHREAAVKKREEDAILKEATLDERDAALLNGWKLLEDRKRLHERNIIRQQQ